MSGEKNEYDVRVAWIDLAKSSLWPASILIFLILISGSISSLLSSLPSILDKAKALEFGDIRVELDENLASKASPFIIKSIEKMNYDQIELIYSMQSKISDPFFQNLKNIEASSDFYFAFYSKTSCEASDDYSDVQDLIEISLLRRIEGVDGFSFAGVYDKLNALAGECVVYELSEEGAQVKNFLRELYRETLGDLSEQKSN